MPNLNSPNDIADTISAPLGELIAAIGRGVADAQQALDEGTLETFKKIYSSEGNLLAELGYQPTWYKIPEVNAEISVSLSISGEAQKSVPDGGMTQSADASHIKLYAAPIDANYTNKYDYDFKAASIIRFKIVPVPPSPQAASLKLVPDLKDQFYKEVKKLLTDLEIPFTLAAGSSEPIGFDPQVINHEPKKGEILTAGHTITLFLSPPPEGS